MKLINLFETKSSLTGRWVGISAENWRISGEIVTKNIKCCRQTGNRGGHFVFWDIEPEMLGHNPAEVPGHRPVILLPPRITYLYVWDTHYLSKSRFLWKTSAYLYSSPDPSIIIVTIIQHSRDLDVPLYVQ